LLQLSFDARVVAAPLCSAMDRFIRRTPVSTGALSAPDPPDAKRARLEGHANGGAPSDALEAGRGDPVTVLSWNVNSLPLQLRNNWAHIRDFVERERADVICLQEVRMPAAGPRGCKRGDGQRRRRHEAKRDTPQEREDWSLVERTLLATFGRDYAVYWALADWKYAGTAMLVRRPLRPSCVTYQLPALAAAGSVHSDPADAAVHPDGRVILAAFETFDLLATYAPNNGNDAAAFARRAAWDQALLTELTARRRPLVWTGDVNCAAAPADVSHPEWFLQQCFQGEPEEMRGQPGFTPGERKRFEEILRSARLIDAHRKLHPADSPPPAAGPHYTWRGHPPVHQAMAKYHGKGMRIDYALVAEELLPRLATCDILGHGADRVGFMGSDHSPIRLTLSAATMLGHEPGANAGSSPASLDGANPPGVPVVDIS